MPGMFIALDKYEKAYGKPEENNHQVHTVHNPLTNKDIDAVFLPKHGEDVFEGCIKSSKKIKMSEVHDDDTTALRPNQVDQSFESHSTSFGKSLPAIMPGAQTFSETERKAANAVEKPMEDW